MKTAEDNYIEIIVTVTEHTKHNNHDQQITIYILSKSFTIISNVLKRFFTLRIKRERKSGTFVNFK